MFIVFLWPGKMGTSVYALSRIWFCDIGITPLTRAWPADVALRLRWGERASKIKDTERCTSVNLFLLSIFSLHFCTWCGRLNWTTAVRVVDAMRPAILPALACAWRHVRLISNVSENSSTWPLYPDTVPLSLEDIRVTSYYIELLYVGAVVVKISVVAVYKKVCKPPSSIFCTDKVSMDKWWAYNLYLQFVSLHSLKNVCLCRHHWGLLLL